MRTVLKPLVVRLNRSIVQPRNDTLVSGLAVNIRGDEWNDKGAREKRPVTLALR